MDPHAGQVTRPRPESPDEVARVETRPARPGDRGTLSIHRWPTALGIGVAGLAAFDMQSGAEFSMLVVLMALVYLGAAVLERRRSAWVILAFGFGAIIALRLLAPSIEPALGLLIIALAFLGAGLTRRAWRGSGDFTLQAVGMFFFGGIALAALYASWTLGGILVATALLAHGVWDVVHFRRNRVVVRSYAEFCAVFDFLLGLAILVTLALG